MNTLTENKSNNNVNDFQNKLISNCLNTKSNVYISPWIKEYSRLLNSWKQLRKMKKIEALSCATLLVSCLSSTETKLQNLLKEYPQTLKSVSIKLISGKMKKLETNLKFFKNQNNYLKIKFQLY